MFPKIKRAFRKIKEKKEISKLNIHKSNISRQKALLPENNFSRKLLEIYSKNPKYIGKEIGLIKHNKKLFDVTTSASKESFLLATKIIRDLKERGVNPSKSSFIHTHILSKKSLRKNINPSFGDVSTFKTLINSFGMKNFEISVLNKNHIEIGRTYLLFDISKKEEFFKRYQNIIQNEKSSLYSKISKNGFSTELLNHLGFKVSHHPMQEYIFSAKKQQYIKK